MGIKRGEGDGEHQQLEIAHALGMTLCMSPSQTKGMTQLRRQVVPTVPTLIKAIGSENVRTRNAAIKALGSFGDKAMEAVPALEKVAIEDPEEQIQKAAGL